MIHGGAQRMPSRPRLPSRPSDTPTEVPGEADLRATIQQGLREYFASDDSRDAFIDATDTAEKGVTWIKWGVALVVVIFGSGIAYNQWIADNATKGDLSSHIKNDLMPVKADVSGIKVSVDTLVTAETKRAERELEQAALDKQLRLLEAHRAEYQEAMAEYTATKAAGKRATRPRKTPAHIALEGELGLVPSRG